MVSIVSGQCCPWRCFFSTSRRLRLSSQIRNSVGGPDKEDEPTQFKIDPETTREALKKLDQQFQSLSQKTQPSVKSEEEKNKNNSSDSSYIGMFNFGSLLHLPLELIRSPDRLTDVVVFVDSDMGMRRKIGREQDMPEISGSFLGYSAAILLAITFLTNILFIVFVQPAFDS